MKNGRRTGDLQFCTTESVSNGTTDHDLKKAGRMLGSKDKSQFSK